MDFSQFKKININNVDLKQLFIDGIQVWKSGYKNQVPTSIDTDGSIYQGTGYIEGYRLSSSGGLSSQAGTITTGFIPCTSNSLIRLGGVAWCPTSGYSYLVFYDSNFTVLGSVNCYINTANASGYASVVRGIVKFKTSSSSTADIHPSENNGVYTFDQITFSDGSQVAYCRINGHGSGANMIVTLNETID